MGKKNKRKNQGDGSQGKDRVIFSQERGCVSFNGVDIKADGIRGLVGLASLGKMMRFGMDENEKLVIVQRVPENIEAFYSEVVRILEKYKDKPVEGFKAIRQTALFAESVLAIEQGGSDGGCP